MVRTVRRKNEAHLREQANLLNLTHDAIFVMDMEGLSSIGLGRGGSVQLDRKASGGQSCSQTAEDGLASD
jgi:hypothetical protein